MRPKSAGSTRPMERRGTRRALRRGRDRKGACVVDSERGGWHGRHVAVAFALGVLAGAAAALLLAPQTGTRARRRVRDTVRKARRPLGDLPRNVGSSWRRAAQAGRHAALFCRVLAVSRGRLAFLLHAYVVLPDRARVILATADGDPRSAAVIVQRIKTRFARELHARHGWPGRVFRDDAPLAT